jgi:IstB-like ATP binding protein
LEREYTEMFGSRFIHVRNRSTYAPQEKNPKGEVHEDLGVFSYDGARKRIVLRQFHVEGFVNQYVMRRYERASTLLTSNRPVDDWGKLLGDTAAVTALLDRLLHHAHVLKCGPRSWRTKVQTDLRTEPVTK